MNAITPEELRRALESYLDYVTTEELEKDMAAAKKRTENCPKEWSDMLDSMFAPRDEAVLCECDLCHNLFGMENLSVDESGKHVYCDRCR